MKPFYSGQMIDVHKSLVEPHVSHTICIVGVFQREPSGCLAVAYKTLIKPLHWRSNPIHSVSVQDARWLIDSGYWELISVKSPQPRYLIAAAWEEVLLDRATKKLELADQLLDT